MGNDSLFFFGKNPFKEAVKKNNVERVYLQHGFNDKNILTIIEQNHLSTKYVNAQDLTNLSQDKHHQGVVFQVKDYRYYSLEEIVSLTNNKNHMPLILILDEINDPHNFGAILRSADAFGVDGVIVKKRNQVLINGTVIKSSAGAANFVKVAAVTNLNHTIEKLKKAGYWIVATDGSAKMSYKEIRYDFPLALIVGSEGFGVSNLLLKNADFIVKIPMLGEVNSLNASVAASIFLAHIRS